MSTPEQTRRDLLAKMGTGLVAITIGTAQGQLTPHQARAKAVPLSRLTESEATTLEALGEVLLPGAAAAGIAHFVDEQLASDNPLLLLRYVDYPGPFEDFYRQGLHALEAVSTARHGRPFPGITKDQQIEIVREISQKNPPEWDGPPAPLFYFVTRGDAVDVYYGTPAGFAELKIPYMAHIMPRQKW